nr:membrane cofactor protein isoform X2 [Dasypus novemcinctus]
MVASSLSHRAFLRRRDSPFPSLSSLGPLLSALVLLLLNAVSDSCVAPPQFQTMKLVNDSKDSYVPGDKLVYVCRLGYTPNKPSVSLTTVCKADNTWTPLEEACKKKVCSSPADPLNGRVNVISGSLEFGSQIEYSCNEGYRLIGQQILYCQISGNTVEWSDDPPVCESILCLPPPNIENGQYSNSGKDTYIYNEVVTYSCKPVSGPDKYSLIGNSSLVCSANGEWNSGPPQCKVVKCEFPSVPNGKQTSGFGTTFLYKARVTFECNEGFVLEGSSLVVCEEDNNWHPPLPTCVKVSTTPVSTPSHTKTPTTSLSVSTIPVSTPSSTKTPIPSLPGSPTFKPPVSSHPGFVPHPTEPPSSTPLGAGPIAAIVVCSGAVILGAFIAWKLYERRKKGTYLTDESHRKVKFLSL